MNITATSCNITTEDLENFEVHFVTLYKTAFDDLKENENLNVKKFMQNYFKRVSEIVDNPSEKYEKALLATLVGSVALVNTARNPINKNYFPDYIVQQLGNIPWNIVDDSSKVKVTNYLDLIPAVKPVVAPVISARESDADYEASLFEINTMNIALLFQPTDSEFYNSNDLSKEVEQKNGIKAFRKFVDYFLNNSNKTVQDKDPVLENIYIRLFKIKDVDSSKIYGNPKGSEYVYLIVDSQGNPIYINDDGVIDSSGAYHAAFYSRIPDEVINNIDKYMDGSTDKVLLNLLIKRGMVLNPEKYKASTLSSSTDSNVITQIETEKEQYIQSLLASTRSIARFIKDRILEDPENNFMEIDTLNSRFGYLKYISKRADLAEKGDSFITDESGKFINGVQSIAYKPAKVLGKKQDARLVINDKFNVTIFLSNNKLGFAGDRTNPRLLPIVDALVELLTDDTILYGGVPLPTAEKNEILKQFYFQEITSAKAPIKHNTKNSNEALWTVTVSEKNSNEATVYKKGTDKEIFKQYLKQSLEANYLLNPANETIKIPTIIQDGDIKTLILKEISSADYIAQYFKLPITVTENSDKLPILNPTLAINFESPFTIKTKEVKEEFVDDELWMSKNIANLSTEKLNKKALEWFNTNPITKNIQLQQLFNIVNSGALATWSRAGVTLYSGSQYTDLYHEAWHEFTEMWFTPEQKQNLLSEVKKIKGKVTYYYKNEKITKLASEIDSYQEAMEFLADEYRMFAINESASVVTKAIKAIFKAIKNLLDSLFGKTTSLDNSINTFDNPVIKEIFTTLYTGDVKKLEAYRYDINQGTTNVLQRTIVGVGKKEERYKFTSQESILLQQAINSIVFDAALTQRDTKSQQGTIVGSVRLLFRSDKVERFHKLIAERFAEKQKTFEQLANNSETTNEDLKKSYREMASLFAVALRNLGSVEKLKDRTENQGIIKYYIEENEFINEIYNDDEEDFLAKDDGQYSDKGNNSTSLHSDFSPYLKLMFSIMPALKVFKENTLYVNDNLTEGIKKVGDYYYRVNMLSGEQSSIEAKDFLRLFNTPRHIVDENGNIIKSSSYVERDATGSPVALGNANIAISKLIETPGLTGTLKPLSLLTIIEAFAQKGTSVTDKSFFASVYGIIGGNAFTKWNSITIQKAQNQLQEKIKLYPEFYNNVKEHFYTYSSLVKNLSREKVPPIMVSISLDKDKKYTIESYIGNTEYISFWNKREVEYIDYTTKLPSEEQKRYGLVQVGTELKFNAQEFFNHPDNNKNYNPAANKQDVVFKYTDRDKIVNYLKLLGILNNSIVYPESLIIEMLKDSTIIDGLNALNIALFNYKQNLSEVPSILSLLKKGIAAIPDLKQLTLVEKVFSYANKIEITTNDYMYKDAKGDLVNEFSLQSSMMRYVQMYNDSDLKAELYQTPEENAFWVDSLLNKAIYGTNPKKFRLFLAGGITNDNNTGISENDNNVFTATIESIINLRIQNAYRMYQHSGKSTQYFISLDKQPFIQYNAADEMANNVFYNQMYNYFIAEAVRVYQTENGVSEGVEMFSKYGKEFLFFDYINDSTKTLVKKLIAENYNLEQPNVTEVINNVKQSLQNYKATIISEIKNEHEQRIEKAINAFAKIDNTILDNVDKAIKDTVGEESDGNGNKLYRHYYMNNTLFNMESHIFFYGDLANYQLSKDEFPKRNALLGSGGNPVYSDPEYITLIKNIFDFSDTNDAIINLKKLPITILEDVKVGSENYSEYEKAVKTIIQDAKTAEKRVSPYKDGMKEADAQGIVLLDTYRMLSLASNNWSSVKEDYYNRIKNNQPLPINVSEFFPSLKYQFAGPATYIKDEKTGKLQMFTLKFNIIPLIPSVLKTKIGEVEKERYLNLVSKKLVTENIAMLTFVSGSKNSFLFDKESNIFYDDNGNLTESPFVKNYIDTTFFKDQLYIAPVFKEKSLVSSQKRTKILDLFYQNGKLTEKFARHKNLVEEYKKSIADATEIFKQKLSSTLQIDLNNPDKKALEKFAGYIKELLHKKGYITADETEMITIVDGAFAQDYLPSGLAVILDGIIANIIEKNILQQKFPGEPLIQVANTGWEFVETDPLKKRLKKDKVRYNNKLKSYRPGPDGTTLPGQVIISMQGGFYKLLNLTHTDGNPIGTVPRLNEMMGIESWKKEHMQKFIITGDRIPVHAHPSMEVLEIVEFIDSLQGNVIILPSEIVAKSGGDFDVDKLTLLYPTFDDAGNILEYSLDYNQSKERIKELSAKIKVEEKHTAAYYKLLRKILSAVAKDLKTTGFQNVGELASSNKADQYRKVVTKNEEAFAEYDDIELKADETLDSIAAKIEDINQKIDDIFNNKPELKTKEDKLTESEKQLIKTAEEYTNAVFYFKNIVGAIGNRINQNVAALLTVEELFPYLILPTTDENLKSIANSTENKQLSEFPIPSEKRKYSYITDPFESLLKLDYNSAGKKSLGIIAVFSSMLNEMAEANLRLPNGIMVKGGGFKVVKIPFMYRSTKETVDVLVDGEIKQIKIDALDYSSLTDLENNDKGDYTGQKIQASVDVEKDPWLLRLGIRKETASFQLGLTGASVKEGPLSIFLLNPMVNQFVRYTEISQTPLLPFFSNISDGVNSKLSTVSKFSKIISKRELTDLIKNSDYSDEIKQKAEKVLQKTFTKDSIIELNNIFYSTSIQKHESINFGASHYESKLNQAVGLIHYIAINEMFKDTINKLSFALRPDRQRFASILDFMIFDKKFEELYNSMPDFTREALLQIKEKSVRSSFYINTSTLPKALLELLSPMMIPVVNFIYEKHYKNKQFESQIPFKDTKAAIKLYSNIIRSTLLQKLLNSRYDNDVYKGFNIITSTEFTSDSNAVETAVLNNDFNILATSAIKVLEVKDELNNVVEKSIYVNKLNIALFAMSGAADKSNADFYINYGMAKPDSRIITSPKKLEKYLIEYEIAKNKYPISAFEKTIYYEQVYKNITEDVDYNKVTSTNKDVKKINYAYELFLRDMALINTMPLSVLSEKSIGKGTTNIGYFINQFKVAYGNILLQSYPVLNNINTKVRDRSENLEVEIIGIKDNLEYYRNQIQTLIDPTKQVMSNSFDNIILSDILTGVGLFSVMQNNTSTTASKVQQLFVNKSLMRNLATISLSNKELNDLLNSILSEVIAKNNHKKMGYVYVLPEKKPITANTLDIVPYRNIKTTKSTLFVAKSVSKSGTPVKKEIVQPGLELYKNALSKEEQKEFFEFGKFVLEKHGYNPFPQYVMASAGEMEWSPEEVVGKNGKPYKRQNDFNTKIISHKKKVKGSDGSGRWAYHYYMSNLDGSKITPIPTNIISILEKVTGQNMSDYDTVLINLYPIGRTLGWHVDVSEDYRNMDRDIVSISIGADADFHYSNTPDNFISGTPKVEEKPLNLKSGDIIAFGGKSRLIAHTVKNVTGTTDLGSINLANSNVNDNFKGGLTLDNWRMNFTFRVADPDNNKGKRFVTSTPTTDTTQTAVSTQPETARTIYDKINKDKKTKSTNVEIAGQGDLSDVKYSAKTFWSEVVPEARAWFGDNLIIAYRGKKTNTFLQNYKGRLSGEPALTIGNPFDWQAETGTRDEQGIKSTKRFIHWMITGDNMGVTEATPEYRQAIIDDIKNGKLKNRPIIYYQEKGYATHATALDYLINEYNWNQPAQPSTSVESMTLKEYADKTTARFVNTKEVLRKDDIEYYNDRVADLIEGRLQYAMFAPQDLNNKQYLPFINKLKENGFRPVEGLPYIFSKNGINPYQEYERLYKPATPTVTAKPTTQTLESKTELEVYIPDYSLAESVYNTIKGREAKGEDFIKIKNELYKKFYDNISQKYDQIPKDTNFNIRYMLGNTVIESANIENEESIKKTLVYDNIPLGNDDRSKQINSILNGLLYINAFVLYQKFGKINKQFLPPKLVAKIMVRETIEQANISEDELNKVLEVIRNC